ncbi:MAG: DNRLRE domain-containing protein [Chitinophagales bacterium]
MMDSGEGYSDAVTMTVREEGANLFVDLVPDDAWLKDPARVYPVTIDPTIDLPKTGFEGQDTYVSNNYPTTNYSTSTFLTAGYDPSGGLGITRSFLWYRLPALPSGSWINSATMSFYQYGSYSTTPTVQLYRVAADWSAGSVTWNNQPTLAASPESSLTQNIIGWYNFDTSNLVRNWYSSGLNNYGIALKLSDEGVQRRVFRSCDYTTDKPKLVINYDVNPLGDESFWTYNNNVHIANGNLMLSYSDVNIPGRGIPATITRTYNSRSTYDDGNFGYGWNSELDMKITPVAKGPIQYIDLDRTVHYFEQQTDGTYTSPPGLFLTLIKNGDNTYTITEKSGLKYNFSSAGLLTSITDARGNNLTYTYTSGKVTTITDPSGRTTAIVYGGNNRVASVTDYGGRQTTYGYSAAGDLTSVTNAAGTADAITTYFEYDSNHNLIAVTDPKGYKTYYYYTTDDRVQSINSINKVMNSNFEVDGDGNTIPDLWALIDGQSGTGSCDLNSQTTFGSGSFKITAASTNAKTYSVYQSDPIPVDRSKAYTLSGYIKGSQTSGTQNAVLSLIAYNSSNQSLGEFARTDKPGTFAWQRVTSSLASNALPTGTTYVRVKVAVSNATGSGTSWFDAVQLEEGSSASEFIAPMTYTVDRANMYSAFYDGNGKKIKYQYNENGNVLESRVDPSGLNYLTTYTWNADGQHPNSLSTMKDANANASGGGDSLTNTYDSNGNLTTSKTNDGTAAQINDTFTYNSNNDLLTEKDGNANDPTSDAYNTTTGKNFYDAKRNPISFQDALATSMASSYNQGNVTSQTSPMGLADNIVVNSSFERDADADNWPDKFDPPTISDTATVTWGTDPYIGNRGITISNVNGYVVVSSSSQIMVDSANCYALSVYVKASSVAAGNSAYIKFDCYDSNNVFIDQVKDNPIGEANGWNKLQLVVPKSELPTGTAKIKGALVVTTNSGVVSFDGMQMEKTPFTSAYNYIDNSSFERGVTTPEYWENTTGIPFSWETTETFIGNRSIKITNPTGWAGYAPDYYTPYDASKSYTVSSFVKSSGLSNLNNAFVKINFYDSSYNLLSAQESNKLPDATTDWTRLEAHVDANAAPSGTAYIRPVATANTFTGTVYFDAIRLQEGIITSSYDYNQADGNGKGANNYVTRETDPLGNYVSYTYDTWGNTKTSTDAKGNTTSFDYDNLDQLKKVTLPTGIDLKTVYTYDTNGNRTQVQNKNQAETSVYNTTGYSYNSRNLLTSITDALNKVTNFIYDASGNQTAIEYPNGKKVGFVYNKANRLEQVTFDGTTKYTFGYDANGNRTSVQDNIVNKTWNYLFDTASRLKKVTAPDNSTQEYTFDKNGNRLTNKVTVGASNYTANYEYSITDKNILLTDHNQNKSKFIYDEKDNLVQVNSGNGTASNQQYDGADKLTGLLNTKADGTILSGFAYHYDANGNRDTVTDNTGKVITYTYDNVNQLLSETDPQSTNTFNYEYDALGNRTKKIVKDSGGSVLSTIDYGYDATKTNLVSVGGQTCTYDDNGNLTDDGSKKYTWDADGRLTEVRQKSDNSLIAQYEYDADGRRVKSVVGSITTNYHYDGTSIRVLYETDASGNLTALYTYSADGLLLSMSIGSATYYYHYNAHGDVVQLTDQSGNVVASYTYDAWGNILNSSGAMANSNPYRYAGYRYDNETGLYYLMDRYYNPDLGRFISREADPDQATVNAYAYCQNNPVNAIDPDGNFIWFVVLGAYYAWCVYDSYKDVQTLASPSSSKTDKALAAVFLAGSVFPGGKIVKTGVKAAKVARHAPFKKAIVKKVLNRPFKELLADIEKNPGNWKKLGESVVASTKKGNKGGVSIEEVFVNRKTGERIYRHTLKDSNGKHIENPHYRPYGKQ